MTNLIPILLADSYKMSHHVQYPKNTTLVYSNLTARSSRYLNNSPHAVFFGLQYFIKEYLINQFNQNFFNQPKNEIIYRIQRILKNHLGTTDVKRFEELYDLGYLPIEIKALEEGTRVPIKTPMLVIFNTHPKFYWLTNALETLMSNILWKPIVSATIADIYMQEFKLYADMTCVDQNAVPFQGHDFSMRGMPGIEASLLSGAGHLTSFLGSDTVPTIMFLEEYYNANSDNEIIAVSVPASEHSVQCLHSLADGKVNEDRYIQYMLDTYPTGIVSVVSDGFDYWKMLTETLPKFKKQILSREGTYVIRPDSSDPVEIICGKEINDVTNEYSRHYDDDSMLKDWCAEIVEEIIREETPHGEYGGDLTMQFKYQDKYYECTVEPFWNRHDKQYYYIDGIEKVEFNEIELTPEEKGSVQFLYEEFGGFINDKGFIELDPHIRLIYGDSITMERQREILRRLKDKGFASNAVVLGIGSYTYTMNTRDTLGLAVKATYGEVDGEGRPIFKDPATDDGMKKSAFGLLRVEEDLTLSDQQSWETEGGMLTTVFKDGKILRETSLSEIRERLA